MTSTGPDRKSSRDRPEDAGEAPESAEKPSRRKKQDAGSREDRLAAALRANLRRRKQASRPGKEDED